ncbi:coniferyl-aldehyde dehydrogenase [Psychromonas sp. psych-6C06]|uniref:coniferyl aldehyde dehydrogenase n=1 Tax=Psychromonas sp. psych-6C06 TaxID=2058089 RepID=UPI000C334053|nr:coniferyl aldehyde dehydrogenase [Psychromonas sp. psych-6C06]PKF62653.1 coniferyl-aldehyde dehydrogenase [Psychromonas sp. psych-6C06]
MAENSYTPEHDKAQQIKLDHCLSKQQQHFKLQPYPSLTDRLDDLKKLKGALLRYQTPLLQAMSDDFGHRSYHDSKMGDLLPTITGINYTLKRLKKWMKPNKRHVGTLFQPGQAFVSYQPIGVIGIIAPWNYPLFLALGPLTTALATGNRAMIKMSEFTPRTNQIVKQMLASIFSEVQVALFTGGVAVAEHFSKQPFDHLIFTGSTAVGKKVMQAASANLTPVTLELGGKSPTIIADDISLDDAVSRFIFGKTVNAGQTCVAPDYILCPAEKVEALQKTIAKQFNRMYPTIANNDDYTAIINSQQLARLTGLIEDARDKGATVIHIGDDALKDCVAKGKLTLTLITQVNADMAVMQDEIFGPILPIVSYDHIDNAIQYINERPTPLALYLCSHDKLLQQKVLQNTQSGGVCLNDATVHVAQDDLPFGGVGQSGMGRYHGHEGFITFSNAKSVFKKGKINTTKSAFPPTGKLIHKLIYRLFIR